MCLDQNIRGAVSRVEGLIRLSLCLLLCGSSIHAQTQAPEPIHETEAGTLDARAAGVSDGGVPHDRQLPGYISGTVMDRAGAVAVGAQVRLARADQSPSQDILSGDNGQFSFANLPPGPFQITVGAEGFETQIVSGVLRPGQAYIMPEIRLPVATVVTAVRVERTLEDVAQAQIQEQEKQRVLGFIPNFYVSYVPDAAPLAPRQKFELAWKTTIDPFTFVGVGALAGVQQATDDFEGYGQGAEGYAKRFSAAYADVIAGTYVGSAILPSLLKQDPRYFYKGTGSGRSRFLYAIANVVICKGDNKRWQPNYSGILGGFAAGGISSLYYPKTEHDGAGLIVQNTLIRFAESAFENVLQEFVVRKLTPRLKHRPPAQP